MVLLSTDKYEKEVRHLLSDKSTYKTLDFNPFLQLVGLINDKLHWAFDVDLLKRS